MFRQKTKVKTEQPDKLVRCQRIAILLSAVLLLSALPWFVFTGKAYAAGSDPVLHVSEQVAQGKKFTKYYQLEMQHAGYLTAKVASTDLGCNVSFSISDHRSRPGKGHFDRTIGKQADGKLTGSIRTDHIKRPDNYYLVVASEGKVKKAGSITVDFAGERVNLEDEDKKNDNGRGAARAISFDSREHHFLLTGYDKRDNEDWLKFHLESKTYIALRVEGIENKGNVGYSIRLFGKKKNEHYCSFDNPTKQQSKLMDLAPGDYYIQSEVHDRSALTNRQIIYSITLEKVKKVNSVKLNKRHLKLYPLAGYNKAKLKAKVNGHKDRYKLLRFESKNPSVASVSSTGRIIAKKKGHARIICYAKDQRKKYAVCSVTVANPTLFLSTKSATLTAGDSFKIGVRKTPAKQKVTFRSTNSSVVSVSASGVVKGKKAGSAKVYALSTSGVRSAMCSVHVKKRHESKKPDKPNPNPEPKDPDDPTPSPTPKKLTLKVSSYMLKPRGTITATVNIAGGRFSVQGNIAIKRRRGKTCVIRATKSQGMGKIIYTLNGKQVSASIVVR